MRWSLLAAAAALSLAGCFLPDSMQGVPPGAEDWRLGYRDGCYSGQAAAGVTYHRPEKDLKRFKSDDEYRKGWEEGYARCIAGARETRTATPTVTPTLTPSSAPATPTPIPTATPEGRSVSSQREAILQRIKELEAELATQREALRKLGK